MEKLNMKEIGERLSKRRKQIKGMTWEKLMAESGVSKGTLQDIFNGTSKGSKVLPQVARALGFTMSDLYGEDQQAKQMPEYSLYTCPVCIDPYCLVLDSAEELHIPGIFMAPIRVVVVPFSEEAEKSALRAVYREVGHKRAWIAEVHAQGDARILSAHPLLPRRAARDFVRDGVEGEVLGAIDSFAAHRYLFYRSS